MPLLPDLHHRLWHAYCCLPRDETGELPLITFVERDHGIPKGTLSRMLRGERLNVHRKTFALVALALRTSEHWLEHGGSGGPKTKYVVPPPPGLKWKRCGEVSGWPEAVATAKRDPAPRVPPEAFLAGADMPLYRHLDRITPELAVAIATFAWETCTAEEQTGYSTLEASRASPGRNRPNVRRTTA
jgi:hypothetical protein